MPAITKHAVVLIRRLAVMNLIFILHLNRAIVIHEQIY